jgi:hypothetical protein
LPLVDNILVHLVVLFVSLKHLVALLSILRQIKLQSVPALDWPFAPVLLVARPLLVVFGSQLLVSFAFHP